MRQFIEYESVLPTVCGDPSKPRCHKGVWEMNLEGSEMRCVFSDGHDGPCQYNYLASQLYPDSARQNPAALDKQETK